MVSQRLGKIIGRRGKFCRSFNGKGGIVKLYIHNKYLSMQLGIYTQMYHMMCHVIASLHLLPFDY